MSNLDVHNWEAVCMVNKCLRPLLIYTDKSNLLIFSFSITDEKKYIQPPECSSLEMQHTDTQCCTLAESPFSQWAQENQWFQWTGAHNN